MRQRDKQALQSAEEAVRDIQRAIRRHVSPEHARINALAGGPTNSYDAAFCEHLAHPRRYFPARRRTH